MQKDDISEARDLTFFLCRMSGLLKNLILSILVYHKPEEVANVPSKWVWVTCKVSQGPFVE